MSQLFLFFQTMIFCVLPFDTSHFNFTETVLNNSINSICSTSCSHSASCSHSFDMTDIAFGSEMGKFIKDKLPNENKYRIKKVVIDPGHGGRDAGCSGSKSKEKQVVLGIGKKLKAYFAANYPDVEVIMTRDSDVFIGLDKRAKVANDAKADLFISIHANYITGYDNVRGTETYVLGEHRMEANLNVALRENKSILMEDNYEENYGFDPNSPEAHIIMSMFQNAYQDKSIQFANQVQSEVKLNTSRRDRGVKQAGFLVLRETAMPSVLIETGYLSNENDQDYLLTQAGQSQMAKAIFEAFKSYKYEVELDIEDQTPYIEATTNLIAEITPSTPRVTTTTQTVTSKNSNIPMQNAQQLSVNVQYCVQLAASVEKINLAKGNWSKLSSPIIERKEGIYYKYQIGGIKSLAQAQALQQNARKIGFTNSFLVAYRDGDKISLSEAKRLLGQ